MRRKFSSLFCSFFLAFAAASHCWSASSELPGWIAAREHFSAGRFEEALLALQKSPSDDFSYFYNLGTIYFKMGRSGLAVAYLEKANRLQSHDFEVVHNLELARKKLILEMGSPQAIDPASYWMERLTDNINADELRGLFGLTSLLFGLLFFRSYWKTRSLSGTFKQPVSWICITALATVFIIFISFKVAENHPPAIFIDSVTYKSGPGDSYLDLGESAPGVKVRVLGSTAPSGSSGAPIWYQVRYKQNSIAWVPEGSLLLL